MFNLGNFSVDEVLYAIAEDFDGKLLYTVDQLSSASISISSDSTDIVDKRGNVVRTIYKTKSGEFSSTSAFMHPQLMNAASGTEIENAATDKAIVMPKVMILKAGGSVVLDASAKNIQVIGMFGSGANSPALEQGASAVYTDTKKTFGYDTSTYTVTVPQAGDNAPVNYLVKCDRDVTAGMKLTNSADSYPDTVQLTLYVSIVDPCDDQLKAAYVVLPSFQASPETTLSFSADDQEMDFNGTMQVDYCSADKALYYIYFPDEAAVTTAMTA